MGDFITNRDGNFLSEIINSILPKAQNASFLVGYFYFSGFAEIYNGLKDKNLRVLVGLEIEQDMVNRVREVEYHTAINKTRGALKATFNESLVDLFNETDYFDSEEKQEAFRLFFNKIKDGSLEIRKTKETNHAKMYLFQNTKETDEGGSYPGALITGSSNLTFSGLKGRLELNAILRTKSDYEEGKKIFDELWETAVILADKDHLAEFENSVIEKIWHDKLYKPYCFFLRVLDEYFSVHYDKDFKTANEINDSFYDLKYQIDAIKLALKTIETHNGVIVSDVVGLGKSIIGSVVAHNMGLRTIIIAPPHLVPQWEEYSIDFNYHAKVFSSGKIEAALQYFKEKSSFGKPWLIIIDEAHKYRNEQTTDYKNLHNLCRANKVMLLTATPFNNRPADIYSMVKLFQLPLKSTIKTVDNLGFRFQELIKQYAELRKKQRNKTIDEIDLKREIESIAGNIRHIISPLVIRRSRLDLMKISAYKKDLDRQKMGFAETGDPEALEYELGEIKDLYLSTLQQISPDLDTDTGQPSYQAARYNAVNYVKPQFVEKLIEKVEAAGIEYNLFIGSQINLSKFMRRLLVQRFESSKRAFEISLNRMIDTTKNILNWIEKRGKVPIFKKGSLPDIESYYRDVGSTDELFSEEIADATFEAELGKFEAKGLFELETEYFDGSFIDDIKSDVKILETIQENWFGKAGNLPDPKRDHFAEIVKREIKNDPDRKIVVFSSYADTVNDLYEKLLSSGLRVFKYTSHDASRKNKETIERNFDAGKRNPDNDYDVLVATDAISEGYNLHRAGTVVNYDIPYNPTRVIQRVGRINRINKKVFERLFIYNYFPTSIGEDETRTKEISTLKMAMINAIIGEDTKVLTNDIELRSYFAQQYRQLLAENEIESWETKYKELLDNARGTKEYETALAIPHRSRVGRVIEKDRKGVLLFGRKKDTCVFKISKDLLGSATLDAKEAFDLLEADIIEQPKPVSKEFETIYQAMKQTLFKTSVAEKTDKQKRDALDKIDIIEKSGALNTEYLDSLKFAVEIGALSGLSMQYIRQLAPKDYALLPQEIDQDFLDRIHKMAHDIDDGTECIILSEELR
uniref:Superfamily II DNA/RNA helicase n=1 Tax=uncultured bacterium contig00013 TaxID=1181504 RepID=A0A806K0R1_9BACT|nr:superfamily II DNA/RNA helicase [uncultured bacterium contig00013]